MDLSSDPFMVLPRTQPACIIPCIAQVLQPMLNLLSSYKSIPVNLRLTQFDTDPNVIHC